MLEARAERGAIASFGVPATCTNGTSHGPRKSLHYKLKSRLHWAPPRSTVWVYG